MKEELLEHTAKRSLSRRDLRTKLIDILGRDPSEFGLPQEVTRLGDLLKIDIQELEKASEEGKLKGLGSIRRSLHKYGCILKGEYSDLGISEEEALIPIKAMDLSSRAKHPLIRNGYICFLGELLATPYTKLVNIRHFGVKSYEEVKSYVEGLGYCLQGGGNTVEEIKTKLRADGEILVEDIFESRQLWLTLNRASIYSLDQLLERDFRSIPGIGETMESDIIEHLRNLSFEDTSKDASGEIFDETERELWRLTQERNDLRMKKVELILEQAEVSAQLREVKASIRRAQVGGQYGKK